MPPLSIQPGLDGAERTKMFEIQEQIYLIEKGKVL
jgi:hypothetical protein